MPATYQAIRVAFLPGTTRFPRGLTSKLDQKIRAARHPTFPEAKKDAIRFIEEAQVGIPALSIGESYLVVIRKIVPGQRLTAVWAWSPSAGGVIPRASMSGVDQMLNPVRRTPSPVQIGEFSERYTRDVFSIFGMSR